MLGSTWMTPSSITTACVRTGRLAGGASTAPVRRLKREACSGHSTSHPSSHPSASDASWCEQVSSMAKADRLQRGAPLRAAGRSTDRS